MPLILKITYADGTNFIERIPAEVWKKNNKIIKKVLFFKKEVASFELDPHLELADTDVSNNSWPPKVQPTRFQLFKQQMGNENPMQRAKRAEETENGN